MCQLIGNRFRVYKSFRRKRLYITTSGAAVYYFNMRNQKIIPALLLGRGKEEILKKSPNKTMRSPMPLQMQSSNSFGYADWKTISKLLTLSVNAENKQTNGMSNRKQNKEIMLKKLSPYKEHDNVTSELNTEVCFPRKAGGNALGSATTEKNSCIIVSKLNTEAGGGSVDVHQSAGTETSRSDSVSSQPSMQTLPLDGHNQSIPESSQAIATTSSTSFGDPTPMTSLNTAAGLQMSGQNDNRSTGARPKLTASRKSKKNSQSKNKHKSVTWSAEKKHIIPVTDVAYEHYRNCILNLPLPNNSRAQSAAVEAVMFMCGRDEPISLNLINIALKFLWVKLGFCPKAVPLYTTICEFKYDERSFVLAFLELCQKEPSMTVANALFGHIEILLSGLANTNQASQNDTDETENIPLQTSNSTPEHNNVSHSLTDGKSMINSGQQSAQAVIDEPLKALEFHIPETTVSHSQENVQHPCEENHSSSHIHPPVSHVHHPVTHIHHPDSHIPHPVPHMSHSDSITNSETSRTQQQQRLPVSKEKMRHLQIEVLKREQERLRNTLTCVLCKSKPVEITLLPCGHFVLCAACSDECNICPVCNKEALAEVKTFLC